MNKFIILIFVILLPVLHGCGIFGNVEPEATEEQASVTEAPSTPTPEEPIQSAEEIETLKDEELYSILSRLPNIPDESIPIGNNENDNPLVFTKCKQKIKIMKICVLVIIYRIKIWVVR